MLACTLIRRAGMLNNDHAHRTPSPRHAHHEDLLRDLEHAVLRLADAVDSEPPIAAALRRFAGTLPGSPPPLLPAAPPPPPPPPYRPSRRGDLRPMLYRALDAGALDARGFDWLMVAEGRARRAASRRALHGA